MMFTDVTLPEALVLVKILDGEGNKSAARSLEEIRNNTTIAIRNIVPDIVNSLIAKGYMSVNSNGEFYLNKKGLDASTQAVALIDMIYGKANIR